MIYADNAATTSVSEAAIREMIPYMNVQYGNPSSLYRFGQQAKEALEEARRRIAACLGCEANEITFTSGGSESDNLAILSAAQRGKRLGKKHILTTAFEHHAVLHALDALKSEGFEVEYLDVHENGMVSAEQVSRSIRPDTCLVTVMYANNEIGTVQPIAEIGAVCRQRGVCFHTDAVQAVGHVPIHVRAEQIDMLSLSAHKFHGPKGIGVLYAKKGTVLSPLIHGGAQERGKRAGTENLPAIRGMMVALEEACERMEATSLRLKGLRDRLIEGLSVIPYAALNGDPVHRLPGNVSFCFEGIEGESLLLLLDDKGICASSGSACTSGSLEPSHVLLAIGRPHEVAHGSLRLSLGDETTEKDVTDLIQAVTEVVEKLRGMSPFWRDLESGKQPHVFSR